MLLNISHHPFSLWSKEQQSVAIDLYGEVLDVAFPRIAPTSSASEVASLALASVKECLSLIKRSPGAAVVHVMGEFTFTFAFVAEMQRSGVTCVASTTDRNVVPNPNGTRTVTFTFVRFREYPPLSGLSVHR